MQPFIKKIENEHPNDWRKYGIFAYGKNNNIYLLNWAVDYEEARTIFRRGTFLHKEALFRNSNLLTPHFKYCTRFGISFNIIGERKKNAKTTRRNKVHS